MSLDEIRERLRTAKVYRVARLGDVSGFRRKDVEQLLDIAEAAQAYVDVPRQAERGPDGVVHFDFKPQQRALAKLEEKLTALRSES